MTDVSEPDLGCVGKDRNKGRVEDAPPGDKPQAPDGVSEDAERLNEATYTVGHCLDMERPVKFGRKEYSQVANGTGDGNSVGRVGPRG